MAKIRWIFRLSFTRLRFVFLKRLLAFRLLFFTFCYNVHVDKYYIADTAMEPLFWVVDHFTKFFGPLFVFVVCSMTASAVCCVYVIGIPYWWQRNAFLLVILFIVGHWLLMNIAFHYYMAATTSPGYLPEGILIPEAVSICKKCISPKPPRTHHCSVCNRCILKMDHHCPWLNNCIGHYNHRYFFLFMGYMLLGVLFIMIFGYGLAYDHIYGEKKEDYNKTEHLFFPFTSNRNQNLYEWMKDQHWYHVCVVYLTFLCIGVFIALGALCLWHTLLISRGETSIEALINRSEIKRYKKEGKVYVNPFNLGAKENWKIFLGLQDGRDWRHVVFPSTHKPEGRGLQWRTTMCYGTWCT